MWVNGVVWGVCFDDQLRVESTGKPGQFSCVLFGYQSIEHFFARENMPEKLSVPISVATHDCLAEHTYHRHTLNEICSGKYCYSMRSKGKSYERRRRKKKRDEWFFGYERHSQTHNFPHFHFVDKCDYVLRTTNFKYIRTQHTLRNTQNPATQMVICYLYSSVISTMLLFLVCESFLNHSEFRDGSRHPKQWRSSKRNRKLCPNSGM